MFTRGLVKQRNMRKVLGKRKERILEHLDPLVLRLAFADRRIRASVAGSRFTGCIPKRIMRHGLLKYRRGAW